MPRQHDDHELLEVFAGSVARGLTDLSPRARVRLAAAAFASIMLARSRMPAPLAIMAAVGFGYTAEHAYVMLHDVHQAAIAVSDHHQAAIALLFAAEPADLPDLAAAVRGMVPDADRED